MSYKICLHLCLFTSVRAEGTVLYDIYGIYTSFTVANNADTFYSLYKNYIGTPYTPLYQHTTHYIPPCTLYFKEFLSISADVSATPSSKSKACGAKTMRIVWYSVYSVV